MTYCSHKTLCVQASPVLYFSVGFSSCSWLLFSLFSLISNSCPMLLLFSQNFIIDCDQFPSFGHILHHMNTAIWALEIHFDKLALFYQQQWNGHIVSSSVYFYAQLNNSVKSVMVKIRAWTNPIRLLSLFLQGYCMTFSSSNWFMESLSQLHWSLAR